MATNFNATALANGTSNLNNRADAINLSTDLVQAGVVFNDAVRISTGPVLDTAEQRQLEPLPHQLHDRSSRGPERHRRDAGYSRQRDARWSGLYPECHRHRGADQRPEPDHDLADGGAADRQRGDVDGCRPDRSTRCRRRSCRRSPAMRISRRRSTTSPSWPRPAPMTSRSRPPRPAPMIRPRLQRRRAETSPRSDRSSMLRPRSRSAASARPISARSRPTSPRFRQGLTALLNNQTALAQDRSRRNRRCRGDDDPPSPDGAGPDRLAAQQV